MSSTLTTAPLERQIKGTVLHPGDSAYDGARTVWNAMVDRHPALIVRCAAAEDVPHAIRFGRAHGLDIAIRGGGHNIAGLAICDDGLVIDFSEMAAVTVDPARRRARVQPGATLAQVDAATQAHALATPVGINSTTGIAGLTLGGGFGWLTRKHGMTIDNLASATLVTADGESRHLSETVHPDLFWAIRGGGGNFGVVTAFEFALHDVGPEVLAGLLVFPLDQADRVIRQYRTYMADAPEDLNVWLVLRKAPPLPFLPEQAHGAPVLVLAMFYAGTQAAGQRHVDALTAFGTPLGTHVGMMPYVAWEQAFDPLLTPGARNYWKSHNFTELSDGAVGCMIEYAGQLPSPHCEIFVGMIAGAANRVAPEATAYAARDAKFVMNVHGRWEQAAEDDECIDWARRFFKAAAPFASPGAYVNFMTAEETGRLAGAYGCNYPRLLEIKRRYDPENVFHVNQNITP